MSEIDQSVPPNSTAIRAQARREAAAMCEAIEKKGRDDLARLKLAQAEELARAEAGAKTSLARTWLISLATVGAVALAAVFALPSLTAPSLFEDGSSTSLVRAMEPSPALALSTAHAEPEVGKRSKLGFEQRDPNQPSQGACNEWDPLAFCMR